MEISKVEIIDGECYVGMNILENEIAKNKLLERENTNLKQALINIRETVKKLSENSASSVCYLEEMYEIDSDVKQDILQEIDEVLGDDING